MKILFLNYEYPPLGGGAGNATEYLLREYSRMPDVEVHLVTSSVDQAYHHFSVGERVFVHRVPIGKNERTLHFQSLVDLFRYGWKGYRFSKKLLSEGKFDAIHAFFSVPCGAQAYLLGQTFKIPYIVSLRGGDVPGYSERFSFLYVFLRPFIRYIWKRAAFVVSNSGGLKTLALKTNHKQDIRVIPNGVDSTQFSVAPGSTDGIFRIISTSRLTPRKGLRYLIEALALLKTEHSVTNIEAFLIGDGNERQALEALAKKLGVESQVQFLGRVPHETLPQWYARSDAFILPSLNEGMSNAMLEALASGLPLLATVTGGTEELLTDQKNGFYLAMRSAEDIADKIQCLLTDPELRKRCAVASRVRAEELSWKNVAKQYVELYKESINI